MIRDINKELLDIYQKPKVLDQKLPNTLDQLEKDIERGNGINQVLDDQNGKCFSPNCKNSPYYIVKAKSALTGELKYLGFCEKHFFEANKNGDGKTLKIKV